MCGKGDDAHVMMTTMMGGLIVMIVLTIFGSPTRCFELFPIPATVVCYFVVFNESGE